jgi:hypothetical protein
MFWSAPRAHPSQKWEDFGRDPTLVTFERSVWKSSELATVGFALVGGGGVTTYKAIEMFGQHETSAGSGYPGLTGDRNVRCRRNRLGLASQTQDDCSAP